MNENEIRVGAEADNGAMTDFPCYAHDGDAGADLFSSEEVLIQPGETRTVGTGVRVAIPVGYFGAVCSKSGIAAKASVFVLNSPGIVDSGYRGEVRVILHNAGKQPYFIEPGDKIAQLLIIPVMQAVFVEFAELDVENETSRGAGGFGSTGLRAV